MFFFSRYGYHRDLHVLAHSFPTRRSSDLGLQTNGLIVAQRHIHMSSEDARRHHVADHDRVDVEIDSDHRTTVFRDVVVRVDPQFKLEMHIDTDEANAAAIAHGGNGELMLTTCHATLSACKPSHTCS